MLGSGLISAFAIFGRPKTRKKATHYWLSIIDLFQAEDYEDLVAKRPSCFREREREREGQNGPGTLPVS